MAKAFAIAGSLSAFLAVAAGAFGAHALRGRLAPDLAPVFETAARDHMYHALALLAVGFALDRWPHPLIRAAGWLFLGGTVAFAGSLYVLSLSGARWWGAITPVGGLLLLAGWVALAAGLLKG